MSDELIVIIEENPVSIDFEDTSFSIAIEETNTVLQVPQEVTQVTLTNQDVTILDIS